MDPYHESAVSAGLVTPRRLLVVRLPVPQESPNGTLWMKPNVGRLEVPPGDSIPAAGFGGANGSHPVAVWDGASSSPIIAPPSNSTLWPGEEIPAPTPEFDPGISGLLDPWPPGPGWNGDAPVAEPLFARAVAWIRGAICNPCTPLGTVFSPANRSNDIGIGHERLEFALFEIDSTKPLNNYRLRLDAVNGFPTPDRAEYFWSKEGKGPPPDTGVDYQDIRILIETGGESAGVATEIPIRILDPLNNPDTTGMGDMNLATKLVLLDGRVWQFAQIFRTYFNTGAASKGLGTGHISMEPGLLARYRWSPVMNLNGELKYWFPIGGDPVHSGQVLRIGLGYSRLLHETDAFALLHTGEFLGYWILDGQKYVAPAVAVDVDGEAAFQFFPGLRLVADPGGDLGLFEFGMSGTFSAGDNSLYDGFLRFDFRWSY